MAVAARRVVVRATEMVTGVDRRTAYEDRLDRLHAIMSEWAQWMRAADLRIGYPAHSALVRGAPGDAYERADAARMELIDAAVEDLSQPIYRAAVQRRYGVCAVWRFPRLNYEEVLMAALEELMVLLAKKGVDSGF